MATSSSPCAACKSMRRKCMPACIFAPHFPPEEPHKFANVHKIFGASNVAKLLSDLLPHQRGDAVDSLAYEAEARAKDPVYGCVGVISVLQSQVQRLQKEIAAANAELLRYACTHSDILASPLRMETPSFVDQYHRAEFGGRVGSGGDGFFCVPCSSPWSASNPNGENSSL